MLGIFLLTSSGDDYARWEDLLSLSSLTKRLPALTEDENLGRSVYSANQARRARNSKITPHVFIPGRGVDKISVDRLDHAARKVMAGIATERGQERSDGPKKFHGWAVLPVRKATSGARWVEASPVDGNPYHADIRMNLHKPVQGEEESHGQDNPDPAKRSRARQTQHALELALSAEWEDAL